MDPTPSGMSIYSRAEHPKKAPDSSMTRLFGRCRRFSDSQSWKANISISVTVSGMVTSVSDEHEEKAYSRIFSVPVLIITFSNSSWSERTDSGICFKEEGKVISFTETLSKTPSAMSIMPSGRVKVSCRDPVSVRAFNIESSII